MGLIKTIIIVAICVAMLCLVVSFVQVPSEEYDCLEEIAKDYCEDNDMIFESILMRTIWPLINADFVCKGDERSVTIKAYKFLDDEIEECKDE